MARVSGLFAGRGYNIESLAVAVTDDPGVSRMTIVSRGSEPVIEQIVKQLNKLVDVIKVIDLTEVDHVQRELMLVKVKAEADSRAEVLRMAEIFRGRVVDVSAGAYTIEVTGDEGKLAAFLELVRPVGILEVVRTGQIAMARGHQGIEIPRQVLTVV